MSTPALIRESTSYPSTRSVSASTNKELIEKIQDFVREAKANHNNIFLCDISKYYHGCKILIQAPSEFNANWEMVKTTCSFSKFEGDREVQRLIHEDEFNNPRLGMKFKVSARLPLEYGNSVALISKIGKVVAEKSSCTIL